MKAQQEAPRRTGLVKKLALSLLSLLVAVGVLEVVLRKTNDLPVIYAGFATLPHMNEKLYRYSFPTSYRATPEHMQRFEQGSQDRKQFDAQLGWDIEVERGRMRRPFYPVERSDKPRVLFLGDSFTFGDDVRPIESMPYFSGELLEAETINMAVPGYGIDQAILKYRYHGEVYAADLVVLGVYRSDYHRSAVSFSAFAKPCVKPGPDGAFLVQDEHIRPPGELLPNLARTARYKSRLLALLEAWSASREQTPESVEEYHRQRDHVVRYLLQDLVARLEQAGTPLLIVQIPRGDDFASDDTVRALLGDTTRLHLMQLYEELGLSVVDATTTWLAEFDRAEIFEEFFVRRKGKIGHMTPRANFLLARTVSEKICELMEASEAGFDACSGLASQANTVPAAQSTIANWTFDTNEQVVDGGPYEIGVRAVGASFAAHANGGGYYELSGADSELVVDASEMLHLTTDFEIRARVRADDPTGAVSQGIVVKGGAYHLSLRDGRPGFYGYGLENPGWHIAPVGVEPGKWHDVAVKLNQGKLVLTLDGTVVYIAQVKGRINASSRPLKFGRGAGHLTGAIDEVRIVTAPSWVEATID